MLPRKIASGVGFFCSIVMFLTVFLVIPADWGGGRSEALAGTASWEFSLDGDWSEAVKWDSKIVPNGPLEFATIDKGATVAVDMKATVNHLTLGSGILNINTAQSLTLGGVSPGITNAAVINVLGGGGWPTYLWSAGTTGEPAVLGGSGVLNMTCGDSHLAGGGGFINDKTVITNHKLGSGSFTVMSDTTYNDSFFLGSNDLTAGAQVTVGAYGNHPVLYLGERDLDAAVVRGGTIWLTPGAAGSSTLRANDCTVTLTDGSTVVLGHNSTSRMDGKTPTSKFINETGSTIRRVGAIAVMLDNYGVINSEGSRLHFDGGYDIINHGTIQNSSSGSILQLNSNRLSGSGLLDAGAGLVELKSVQITNHKLGGSTGILR